MSLRGKAAIVGFSELPTLRNYPCRTTNSLCSEAIRLAIADAGLTKDDVDGLITRGTDVVPTDLAEYYGLKVSFNTGVRGTPPARLNTALAAPTRWPWRPRPSTPAWPTPWCASSAEPEILGWEGWHRVLLGARLRPAKARSSKLLLGWLLGPTPDTG